MSDDGWVDTARDAAGACPRCGSTDARPVVYGMPLPGEPEHLVDRVVFAGCVVPEMPSAYACGRCGTEWGEADLR